MTFADRLLPAQGAHDPRPGLARLTPGLRRVPTLAAMLPEWRLVDRRAPADVAVSVWTGAAFTRLVTRSDGALSTAMNATCVRGTSTGALDTLRFATQRQQLVIAVHVDAAPATGVGMPSLHTAVLEPVVVYER